ncbi:MAG: CDP-alcohol phosphatidyltransferase family protein [Chthoniobacteraceae bacterium]
MPESRRPLTSRDTRWAKALSGALARRGVTPNAISVAGMIFASIGALGLAATPCGCVPWTLGMVLGVAGAQLRLLCNLLDGMVAIEGGLKGKAGDLFNEAPDRLADIVLLVGAGYAAGAPWLGWMAASAAVLTAYVRAFGASVGQGQDFCGPLAKPHRMFFFSVGCLGAIAHPPALAWSLWLVAIGAFFTAARRVVRLYRKLP